MSAPGSICDWPQQMGSVFAREIQRKIGIDRSAAVMDTSTSAFKIPILGLRPS